jgi:hypothetical protein
LHGWKNVEGFGKIAKERLIQVCNL